MIWFSSDWHFSHKNIAGSKISKWKDGFRTFDSIQEMNDDIINNINSLVKWDDTLYFLGDFAFGDHKRIPEYRNRIACQNIHICIGNHDENYNDGSDISIYSHLFSSVNDTMRLKINGQDYFLSHYSHRIWPSSHRGTIHLYGHSHDSIPDYGKSMDVGIDVAYRMFGKYRPFSITEIIDIMDKKEIGVLDHHVIKKPQ
jgi:hypothetical protein